MFPIENVDEISTCEPTTKAAAEPTTETTPTKYKKSKLKLEQKFNNEIIADEKGINNEICLDCFKYQNPSFLIKDLINKRQKKRWEISK